MPNNKTIYTGFPDLDNLTGGFKKGELILIAGRPAMGKTSFVFNTALYYINKNNWGYFLTRNAENLAKFDNLPLKPALSIFNDENDLKSNLEQFSQIRLRLLNYKKQQKDTEYLNKYGELSFLIINGIKINKDLLKYLKNTAKELNVPVIVTAENSDFVDEQKGFADSSMNEIPDKILFLYRDDYYDLSDSEKRNTAKIIVAKNNTGETGTVNLLFDKEKQKFWNIEENVFVFNQISSVGKNSFTAKYGDYWFEIDTNGKLLYKMKCQNLRRISNDLLIAKINNKEGLIDNDFNVVAGFEYSDFKTLDKNFEYFKFRKNKKWGVVDKQGKIIIEPKYSKIERADKDFNNMFVTLDGKKYLIDRHEKTIDDETAEKLICTPEFVENKGIGEKPTWRIIQINDKYGLVDNNLNQLKIHI